MQVVEDVDHSIDVVRNSTSPESLIDGEMKPTHPQDSSRFPSDSLVEFPSLIGGTGGSNNLFLHEVKVGDDFLDLQVHDSTSWVESEIDELLASFQDMPGM
jgi:hypothetical protein